jgi:8-hydroxy-5-deazaflavin:NADPH oxidoreductase
VPKLLQKNEKLFTHKLLKQQKGTLNSYFVHQNLLTLELLLLKIGIIGGTGSMGRGLAFRLSKSHDVFIISRNYEKAVQTGNSLEATARGFHGDSMQGSIKGASDKDAVENSEAIILTIPAESTIATIQDLKAYFHRKQIIISPIVPMKKSRGNFRYILLPKQSPITADVEASQPSAAELIQEIISPVPVVSAFHTVPAAYLTDVDKILDIDVFVAGDDDLAVVAASKLICEIPRLRPLKAGPLENSRLIESMVPLLLNVAVLNNLKEPSIRVVPWIATAFDGCT